MTQPKGVTLVLTEKRINLILFGVPDENDYSDYLKYFKAKKVKHIFIATEFDDKLNYFSDNGMELHSINFEDGNAPPQEVIDEFLNVFHNPKKRIDEFIAVGCKRGYGRAPTIAAVALLDRSFSGMQTLKKMRNYNPRFITERQKQFILNYEVETQENCCRI